MAEENKTLFPANKKYISRPTNPNASQEGFPTDCFGVTVLVSQLLQLRPIQLPSCLATSACQLCDEKALLEFGFSIFSIHFGLRRPPRQHVFPKVGPRVSRLCQCLADAYAELLPYSMSR